MSMDNETALLALLDAAEQDDPELLESIRDVLESQHHEVDGLGDHDEARSGRLEQARRSWIASRLAMRVRESHEPDEDGEDADDIDPETLAEIFYGLYGDKALEIIRKLAGLSEGWDAASHPRGKGGKFIKKGSSEAVEKAKQVVSNVVKGDPSADPKELLDHLSILTVEQIRDIGKEHGKKIPKMLREDLVSAVAQLVGKGDGKPAEKNAEGEAGGGSGKQKPTVTNDTELTAGPNHAPGWPQKIKMGDLAAMARKRLGKTYGGTVLRQQDGKWQVEVLKVEDRSYGRETTRVAVFPVPDQSAVKPPEKPRPPEKPPATPPRPQMTEHGYEFSERAAGAQKKLRAMHDEAQKHQAAIDDIERQKGNLYKARDEGRITGKQMLKEISDLSKKAMLSRAALIGHAATARESLLRTVGGDSRLTVTGKGETVEGSGSPAALGAKFVSGLLRGAVAADVAFVHAGSAIAGRPYFLPSENHISLPRGAQAHHAAHELGHWIEHNVPGARDAAQEFLQKRVGNEPLTSIKDKFGQGYGSSETGRKDNFGKVFGDGPEAYYVGKHYGEGDTEILAMGIEQLYRDPAGFAAKDPEYFQFVVSVLDGSGRKGNSLPKQIDSGKDG